MSIKRKAGFTLLELIVVITIIGILGTFVVVRIAGSTTKAKMAKADHDLKAIYSAATAYEAQTGNWPETLEELVNPQDDNGLPIPGTLDKYPKDPWGNDYVYELRDIGPVIICYGRDNAPGGEAEDLDHQHPAEDDEGF